VNPDIWSAFENERNKLTELLASSPSVLGWAAEVGCLRGRTSRALAEACQLCGTRLLCVDPWDDRTDYSGEDNYQAFLLEIEPYKDVVTVERRPSLEVTPPDGLAFVFIEGVHRDVAQLMDMYHWWPALAPSGIMVLHDTFDAGWGFNIRKHLYAFTRDKLPCVVHHHVYHPTDAEAGRHGHGVSGLSWVFKGK
jgi:hypothetical protein